MSAYLRTALASFRFQLLLMRNDPHAAMALATTPLFAVVFLAIVRHAGRDDLVGFAALAPVLISLWQMSTNVSGEIIAQDRGFGTLEPIVATPASYASVLLGRVTAVSTVGLLSFVEVWLVTRLVFGVTITVEHRAVFVATVMAAVFAMSGTALVMASVFALGRSTRIFQQTMTYPFYVLGGVLVPIALLPEWLQPLSRIVFLSWTADLLRDTLQPGKVDDVAARLAAVAALGGVTLGIGGFLLDRVMRRVRRTGTLGYA